MRGTSALGLEAYLMPEDQSCIITTFLYPSDPRFDFVRFYGALSERGFIIYPGKLTVEPCFRIGTIGRISPPDIEALLREMREVLSLLGLICAPADRK
jgi:2-aminoethylphosphonate-pyruvate transaminase